MGFCDEKEAKRFFEERPFSNDLVAKSYIKRLSNMNMLCEIL